MDKKLPLLNYYIKGEMLNRLRNKRLYLNMFSITNAVINI